MLRSVALALIAVYAVAALAACPSAGPEPAPDAPTPTARLAEPKAFVLNLLAIAKAGDQAAFTAQLSAAQRARTEGEIARSFQAWAEDLLALEAALPSATVHLTGDGPRRLLVFRAADASEDTSLLRVVLEDGALKLDEN